MIVVWISHDNRKRRRAMMAMARRKGLDVQIKRATSGEIFTHIVHLTDYLINPDPEKIRVLAEMEGAEKYLLTYLGEPKPDEDHADNGRLALKGERVLMTTTRNLLTDRIEDQQFEMGLIAGMAPGREDPIEHVVTSCPEGEHPSPEQVEAAIDLFLKIIDMERHQVFATLHGDTDHDHLHLAINRVDPLTGKRKEFGNNITRPVDALHQAIAVIAHRQGWSTQSNALYVADDAGCFDRETGIKVLDQTLLPVADSASWRHIRDRRAERKREAKIPEAAKRYERRTGLYSIQRRMLEDAAPVLKEAGDWPAVHVGLAALGMRYRILQSGGAVIGFGDRAISASTAWGGASAAKMIDRLGSFSEPSPDCLPVPFVERTFPGLAIIVEKERKRKAIKAAQALSIASAATTTTAASHTYHDALCALDDSSRGTRLNESRSRVASAKQSFLLVISELRRRNKQREKAWRAKLRANLLPDEFLEEECPEVVGAILIGARGQDAPVERQFQTRLARTMSGGDAHYFKEGRLAFVERRNRIELHLTRDEDVLREALLLAAAKWGSVVATGDQATLHRIAQIAVEENIKLTNPELQPIMAQMRRRDEDTRKLERDLAELEQADWENLRLRAEHNAQDVAVLEDYSPEFRKWYRQRIFEVPDNDALALRIASDPKLAKELDELSSQRIGLGLDIQGAADRERRRLEKAKRRSQPDLPESPHQLVGGKLHDISKSAAAPSDATVPPPQRNPVTQKGSLIEIIAEKVAAEREASATRAATELGRQLYARLWQGASPSDVARQFLIDLHDHPEYYQLDRAGDLICRALAGNRKLAFDLLMREPRIADYAKIVHAAARTGDQTKLPIFVRDAIQISGHHSSSSGWIGKMVRDHDLLLARLPQILAQKPLLSRREGLVGIDDEHLVIAAGENALGLYGDLVQAQLAAAHAIQSEERRECLSMIHSGEVEIEAEIRDKPAVGVIIKARDPAHPLPAYFAQFSHDPLFLIEVKQLKNTNKPDPERLHPMVRAWQKVSADEENPNVSKYIAKTICQERDMNAILRAAGQLLGKQILRSGGAPHLISGLFAAGHSRGKLRERQSSRGRNH